MKLKFLTTAVIALALLLAASAQQKAAPKPAAGGGAEQALKDIETKWATAMTKGDAAALDSFIAEDWVFTDSDAMVRTKAQFLADVKSGAYKMQSAAAEDLKVQVHGNAGVVTGRWASKGTYKGKDISGSERFTDTFVNEGGKWHCIATHESRIAAKKLPHGRGNEGEWRVPNEELLRYQKDGLLPLPRYR